jgi:hypothetical protein
MTHTFFINFQICFFDIGDVSLRRRVRAFRIQDSWRLTAQEAVEGFEGPHRGAAAAATTDRVDPAVVVGLAERARRLESAVARGFARREEAARGCHGAPSQPASFPTASNPLNLSFMASSKP